MSVDFYLKKIPVSKLDVASNVKCQKVLFGLRIRCSFCFGVQRSKRLVRSSLIESSVFDSRQSMLVIEKRCVQISF